ncbi:site-2 protease family protein, partial [Streptococcus suis]
MLIFGVIEVVHEFGHFYYAKKAGILVREVAIGMGPKNFAHTGKDGPLYTLRILPLGGYVR